MEIDFRHEASNCKKCGEIFAQDKRVVVPKIYGKYTTERVITMSFEDGTSIGKITQL